MSTGIEPEDLWRLEAACQSEDPVIFEGNTKEDIEAAKAICGECAVRSACLDFAFATDQRTMIYGGLTRYERKQVRRGQRDRNDLSVAKGQFNNMPPNETTLD